MKLKKIAWKIFVTIGIITSITLGSVAIYRINSWSTISSGDGTLKPKK